MSQIIDIKFLSDIALLAGSEILKIYDSNNFNIELKQDDSPLTKADKISHNIIVSALAEKYPDIPVISEEGKGIPADEREKWSSFFLVDPLDGTKEFIKKNGEFTVNIALIRDKYPVAGVIYAPVLSDLYHADEENGAFHIKKGVKSSIKTEKFTDGKIKAVKSRSHSSPEEDEILSKFDATESISIGSSLKFCLVASGKAQVYYRKNPTWEWDTAAGQAIVEISGGFVTTGGERLSYNKPTLLNSSFLATSLDHS